MVEKYIFTILSVVFAWFPAIIVAMVPLVTSDVYYVFNVNSLTVQNDGYMPAHILIICWYLPLFITLLAVIYCLYNIKSNEESVFASADNVELPVLFATFIYIFLTVSAIAVGEFYRDKCRQSIGQVIDWHVYGFFFTQQAYILKPWFMLICMLATDINYVRTFILQTFLPTNQLDEVSGRNGMSFFNHNVSE